MIPQQGSGNLGQAVREVGRAGSNNSARDNHSHSHDESPDGEDTGSPVFRNGVGSKRGGIKTKRNARQQDQNKQVAVFLSLWLDAAKQCQMLRSILQCALAHLAFHPGLWAQAATSAEPTCLSLQVKRLGCNCRVQERVYMYRASYCIGGDDNALYIPQSLLNSCGAVQAQQRYRERRKQKFNEMEESLHALESQVEQMNSVQSQNNMLQVLLAPFPRPTHDQNCTTTSLSTDVAAEPEGTVCAQPGCMLMVRPCSSGEGC